MPKLKVLKYGVITNTMFSVFLRANADIVQQTIEANQQKIDISLKSYNLTRTANIAKIGAVIGPLMYAWYKYLDYILPGKAMTTIAKKILLDQIVGGIGFIFVFITGICLIEGQSLEEGFKEFTNKFPFIYMVK